MFSTDKSKHTYYLSTVALCSCCRAAGKYEDMRTGPPHVFRSDGGNFLPQIFWTIFLMKFFCLATKILSHTNILPRTFFAMKIFAMKIFCHKNFLPRKLLATKIFCHENFLPQKFLAKEIFSHKNILP